MPDYTQVSTPDDAGEQDYAYSKKPSLGRGEAKKLKDRMRRAQRRYEDFFEPKARRNRQLYQGLHWQKSTTKSKQHWIVVNYLQHVVETQVASIAFSEPEIILKPLNPEGQINQSLSEKAVAWAYREAKAHRETRRALKDSKVYGFGVVLTYWEFETKDAPPLEGRPPVEGEPPDPEAVLARVESGQAPEAAAPTPQAEIVKDQPACRRLDPRALRVDPESDWVIDNAAWVGYVEVRELDEVKADPRYRNTRQLKGSSKVMKAYLTDVERREEEDKLSSDCKRVELWHYFEKRRRLHVVLTDEHDQALLSEPWYWEHERYPVRLIFDDQLEDEFYAEVPGLMKLEHQQREINEVRSQLATHRRRGNTKLITTQGAFDKSNQAKLESDQDMEVVVTKLPNPAGAVSPMPQLPMNPTVYESDRVAQTDLRTLSTLDQYELGTPPTKRLTTTEVSAIQGAGGARQKAAAQKYEELCAGVAEDFLDLLQQFAVRERSLPIYADEEAQQIASWRPWTKDDITGAYQFAVYVGSTEVKNQQGRAEEFGFLLQSLAPYAALINVPELIKQMLANFPDVKDINAIITPPAPPPGMMPPGGPAVPGAGPDSSSLGPQLGGNGGPPAPPPDLQALLAGFGPQGG